MFDFDGGQFSNLTHPSRQPSFGIMIDHHHPDFLTTKKKQRQRNLRWINKLEQQQQQIEKR